MKKILCMLLAVLLLASLGTAAFADGWQEVFEENGFTLTFTDAFRTENLKGIFSARAAGKIDDGLYYAEFLYMGISEEELSVILEKEEDEISEADKALIRSKQGTLAVVYGIDYTKISEENLAIQESIADRVTELATAGDVVFYRYNIEDYEETAEFLAGIAPAYQEEYRTLQADFNEALKTAEFYTPINRAEQLVGNVISFETTDLAGNPVSSEEIFAGHKVTMVNIWATWCDPCKAEMPELGDLARRIEAEEKDAAIVGICYDADEELEACKEILAERNVEYLNLLPFDNMDDKLYLSTLPTTIFVNRDGVILLVPIEGVPSDLSRYEQLIDAFIGAAAPAAESAAPPTTIEK